MKIPKFLKILLITGFFSTFLVTASPAAPDEDSFLEWARIYDSSQESIERGDEGRDLALDSQENLVVLDVTSELQGSYLYRESKLLKYSPAGVLLDSALLAHPFDRLLLDPAGNIYLGGTTDSETNPNIVLTKITPSGVGNWTAYFDRDGEGDWLVDLGLDDLGNVYATGKSGICYNRGLPTERCVYEIATLRFSQNGSLDWSAYLDNPNTTQDRPEDMVVDPAGNIYVTGNYTAHYAPGGSLVCSDYASNGYAIGLGGSGDFYTINAHFSTGYTWDSQPYSQQNFQTLRYSPGCSLLWSRLYDYSQDDDVPAVLWVDASDQVFVGGLSCRYRRNTPTGDCSTSDIATLKYTRDGDLLWSSRQDLGAPPTSILLDNSGDLYLAGNLGGLLVDSNPFLFKLLGATGVQSWRTSYNPYGSNDQLFGMVLDGAHNLYLAGTHYLSPDQATRTDVLAVKYSQIADLDGDGVPNDSDNCPATPNPDQADCDADGDGDVCDNCLLAPNPDQANEDEDAWGNVCDNCPYIFNDQADADQDGDGNACDNCRTTWNPDQLDTDQDGDGNACDNCPAISNPEQTDNDGDSSGDACDPDDDNDGVPDTVDICPYSYDPNQSDTDHNGIGDACNDAFDPDGDEWENEVDNCSSQYNPRQQDINHNDIGDACEFDLRVSHIEFTQAIQDWNNSVPLYYGKDTWVRVYFDVGQAGVALEPVNGTLRFKYANGLPMPAFVDGLYKDVTVQAQNAIRAVPFPDSGEITDSLNFLIPGDWVWNETPYIQLNISYSGALEDINPWNNSPMALIPLVRQSAPTLNVGFVPIYGGTNVYVDGVSPCPPPTSADFEQAYRWLRKVYPISGIEKHIYNAHFSASDPTDTGTKGAALWDYLFWFNTFTNDPFDNMVYYAMVCSELEPTPWPLSGAAQSGMGWGDEAWSIRQDYYPTLTLGGEMMAHEIGHTLLGSSWTPMEEFWPAHVQDNCNAPGPYFEDYPRTSPYLGMLDDYGFDGSRVYTPDLYYDFMTYAPCAKVGYSSPGAGQWVSKYTYHRLSSELEKLARQAQPPDLRLFAAAGEPYLIASGTIHPESGLVQHRFQVHTLEDGPYNQPGEGPYSLVIQAANGASLFTRYFQSGGVTPATADEEPLVTFNEILPFPAGAARIVVFSEGSRLGEFPVSAHAPTVNLIYPNGGEALDGEVAIAWNAADADGDILAYDLLHSRDGGTTWSALALNLAQPTFTWDTRRTPGGENSLLRVVASDGVQTAWDQSNAAFRVAGKAPEVTIITPQTGATLFLNEMIILEGEAYDLEDGTLSDASLTWSSNIDGSLGSGAFLSVFSLSTGSHHLTLSATDSSGALHTAQISVTVVADGDQDGDRQSDGADNCPAAYNPDQADQDADGLGDACDDDDQDADGYPDRIDNCPLIANSQEDQDQDGVGNACDSSSGFLFLPIIH